MDEKFHEKVAPKWGSTNVPVTEGHEGLAVVNEKKTTLRGYFRVVWQLPISAFLAS